MCSTALCTFFVLDTYTLQSVCLVGDREKLEPDRRKSLQIYKLQGVITIDDDKLCEGAPEFVLEILKAREKTAL